MKSVLVSIAHSSKDRGAVSPNGTPNEYDVSKRASMAVFRHLSGEFAVELYDCGYLDRHEYDDAKVARVNSCCPSLAIEIHCNSPIDKTDTHTNYFEAIYASEHSAGKEAAWRIVDALAFGYKSHGHGHWKNHGARADDRDLFFLQRTTVPCVIVEGCFISNTEQARWLAGPAGFDTGQDEYGTFVAQGLKKWLREIT